MASKGTNKLKASRKNPVLTGPVESGEKSAVSSGPARVLIVEPDAAVVEIIGRTLQRHGITHESADSPGQARERFTAGRFDLAVIDHHSASGEDFDLLAEWQEIDPITRLVVLGDRAEFDDAITAIRRGASDYALKPGSELDIEATLLRCVRKAEDERRRDATLRRLRRICKRLNDARYDVTMQIDELCNDLVTAYDDLSGQISHVTTVTEFNATIRQDLDVEDLLRTTLEYFLRRIGPMNAAVFLPGTGDEFTLGAYINYDCPKDAADSLLDMLADVIPPLVMDEPEVLEFRTEGQVHDWLGEDAHWLQRYHVVTFSCQNDGECLAIFTLFRDRSTPFDETFASLMGALSRGFSKHLAHIIHVQHRHRPADFDLDEDHDDWSSGDDGGGEDDDIGGLAA